MAAKAASRLREDNRYVDSAGATFGVPGALAGAECAGAQSGLSALVSHTAAYGQRTPNGPTAYFVVQLRRILAVPQPERGHVATSRRGCLARAERPQVMQVDGKQLLVRELAELDEHDSGGII